MALREGAVSSVCCEIEESIAQAAGRVVEQNGMARKIKVLHKDCTKMTIGDMPNKRKADVLVAEVFDTGLLGEEWLNIVRAAWDNGLLREHATVIPSSAVVYAIAIHLPRQAKPLFTHFDKARMRDALNFTAFNSAGQATSAVADVRLKDIKFRRMSEAEPVLDFSFMRSPPLQRSKKVTLRTTAGGIVNAIAFWFSMELGGGAEINTSPDAADGSRSHWKQAVQLLDEEVVVQDAQHSLEFNVKHDMSKISFAYIGGPSKKPKGQAMAMEFFNATTDPENPYADEPWQHAADIQMTMRSGGTEATSGAKLDTGPPQGDMRSEL